MYCESYILHRGVTFWHYIVLQRKKKKVFSINKHIIEKYSGFSVHSIFVCFLVPQKLQHFLHVSLCSCRIVSSSCKLWKRLLYAFRQIAYWSGFSSGKSSLFWSAHVCSEIRLGFHYTYRYSFAHRIPRPLRQGCHVHTLFFNLN